MILKEVKKNTLALIEELNPQSEYLTDDEDIRAKIHGIINHIQFELARMKKLPEYVEMDVQEGDVIRFADIKEAAGVDVYQIDIVRGVDHDFKANGTIIKALEAGTLEIEFFRYPTVINDETADDFEMELQPDTLEILPYGVAGDLLKSDVSAEYGKVYSDRYETMLQRLDSRNAMSSISFAGGVDI
jgi:hypothetical protein